MPVQTVTAEITGKVWKIAAPAGTPLAEDQPILILESMKMEIPIAAPVDCTVMEILVSEGETVTEGEAIARIQTQD